LAPNPEVAASSAAIYLTARAPGSRKAHPIHHFANPTTATAAKSQQRGSLAKGEAQAGNYNWHEWQPAAAQCHVGRESAISWSGLPAGRPVAN